MKKYEKMQRKVTFSQLYYFNIQVIVIENSIKKIWLVCYRPAFKA